MDQGTPQATVEAFVAEWSQGISSIQKACDDWLSDDVAYENVGLTKTGTRAGAKDVIATLLPDLDAIEVEMLGIAAAGDTVFTERVDHLLRNDGSVIASLRLMGVGEAPDLGTVRLNEKKEASSVSFLVRLRRGLECFDCDIGKHGTAFPGARTGSNPAHAKVVGRSGIATNNLTKNGSSCKGTA